jgi:uncharacterized protein YgiM (DUF1202 family)
VLGAASGIPVQPPVTWVQITDSGGATGWVPVW